MALDLGFLTKAYFIRNLCPFGNNYHYSSAETNNGNVCLALLQVLSTPKKIFIPYFHAKIEVKMVKIFNFPYKISYVTTRA